MRNFARSIAVFYLALMFLGKRFQERVKNPISAPDMTAVAVVTIIVCLAAMAVLQTANNHGHFLRLTSLPYRAILYPMFFLIYFINWRIWRKVTRPESRLGRDSRELAERLPIGAIPLVIVISMALFIFL